VFIQSFLKPCNLKQWVLFVVV